MSERNHSASYLHTKLYEEEQNTKANNRIKMLKEQGQSCLTCKHFPISWGNDRSVYCTHPHRRKDMQKKPIKHYNICALHTIPRMDFSDKTKK